MVAMLHGCWPRQWATLGALGICWLVVGSMAHTQWSQLEGRPLKRTGFVELFV
jgi:hypothetical protein